MCFPRRTQSSFCALLTIIIKENNTVINTSCALLDWSDKNKISLLFDIDSVIYL